MKKSIRDILGGIILGGVVIGGIVGAVAGEMDLSQMVSFKAQSLWLMKQARAILDTYYVNGDKEPLSEDVLFRGAVRGMVASLGDPYTRYTDPEQLKEEEIEMQGEYGGLGIYIGQREGNTVVISPIEDTPADRVGIKPEDVIVKIEDEYILNWDQNQVVNRLRGKPGTKVTIWVRRKGEEQLLRFDIVREIIKIKTVRAEMLSNDIGYVRLNHFNQKAREETRAALEKLQKEKARGIIFDLRNNPGGLLTAAVDIASIFLDGGLVVSTKGRIARANEELFANSEDFLCDLPLLVLINEGSASASEIVAGALKDRERAVVMGEKSFGKGSVQSLFNLPDGSGVYVTIAKYYTPSGFVIDHVGLSPDIFVSGDLTRERSKDMQLREAEKEMLKILKP